MPVRTRRVFVALATVLASAHAGSAAAPLRLMPSTPDKAVYADAEGLAARYPDDPVPMNAVAGLALRRKDYGAALVAVREAVRLGDARAAAEVDDVSTRALSLDLQADAAMLSGQADEALRAARRETEAEPSWPFAWARLVEVAYRSGDVGAASGAVGRLLSASATARARGLPDRGMYVAPSQWPIPAEARLAADDAAGVFDLVGDGSLLGAPGTGPARVASVYLEAVARLTLDRPGDRGAALAGLDDLAKGLPGAKRPAAGRMAGVLAAWLRGGPVPAATVPAAGQAGAVGQVPAGDDDVEPVLAGLPDAAADADGRGCLGRLLASMRLPFPARAKSFGDLVRECPATHEAAWLARAFLRHPGLATADAGPAAPADVRPRPGALLPRDRERDARLNPATWSLAYPDDPMPLVVMAGQRSAAGQGGAAVDMATRAVAMLAKVTKPAREADARTLAAHRALVRALVADDKPDRAAEAAYALSAALPSWPVAAADGMARAFAVSDMVGARRQADEWERRRAAAPADLPPEAVEVPPHAWIIPAWVRLLAGDVDGTLLRLEPSGPAGPPPSDVDRADGLLLRAAALTARGGSGDDAGARAAAHAARVTDHGTTYLAWEDAAAALAGEGPVQPHDPGDPAVEWRDHIVRVYDGVEDEATARAAVTRRWMALQASAAPGAARTRVADQVTREGCIIDFFMAVRRGSKGDAKWLDVVRDVAGRCPTNLTVTVMSRAIAGRWR